MVDIEDGDGFTGIEELDDEYLSAAKALKRKRPARALDHLFQALEVGQDMDETYITKIIEAIFCLLGDGHKVSKQYQAQLADAIR